MWKVLGDIFLRRVGNIYNTKDERAEKQAIGIQRNIGRRRRGGVMLTRPTHRAVRRPRLRVASNL